MTACSRSRAASVNRVPTATISTRRLLRALAKLDALPRHCDSSLRTRDEADLFHSYVRCTTAQRNYVDAMKQLATLAIILGSGVGVLGAGGCGRHVEPPPLSTVVTLRDPGNEPRRALSYHATAAPASALRFLIQEPGMTVTMRWELIHSAADGAARYRFGITDYQFPMGGSDMIASGIATAIRTNNNGEAIGDAHGRFSAAVSGAVHTTPSGRGLLNAFVVTLPVEPIGVGARWHVVRPCDTDPAQTEAVDYELTALTGDVASVRWDIPPSPPIAGDPGVTVSTLGTATVHLDDFLPQAGQVSQVLTFSNEKPAPPILITLTRS
jgi:hypothetical protein